jgi:hypothetical protein
MHKLFANVALVCLAGTFSSCANIGAYQAPWLGQSGTQPTYYAHSRRSRSSQRSRPVRSRMARHEPTPPPADATATADAEKAPAVEERGATGGYTAPAALTLAGDNGYREHALQLLHTVDAELDRARTRPLTAAQQQSYARASELADRARRALAENDYAAASSLARKARSLAAAVSHD